MVSRTFYSLRRTSLHWLPPPGNSAAWKPLLLVMQMTLLVMQMTHRDARLPSCYWMHFIWTKEVASLFCMTGISLQVMHCSPVIVAVWEGRRVLSWSVACNCHHWPEWYYKPGYKAVVKCRFGMYLYRSKGSQIEHSLYVLILVGSHRREYVLTFETCSF